jgi:hypothetical protein
MYALRIIILLGDEDLFWPDFHTKITTSHHDTVRHASRISS